MSSFGDLNRVNTNIQSLNSQLSLNRVNRDLAQSQLRMSTGLRINRAEDDAAGYSTANKLRSRVTGLSEALRNVGDAKSVLDIAESSFDSIIDNLIEMKGLATRAGNDTMGTNEREILGRQIAALGNSINEMAAQTVYMDYELLRGDNLNLSFLVGERAQDVMDVQLEEVNVNTLFSGSNAQRLSNEVPVSENAFEVSAATAATQVKIQFGDVTELVSFDVAGFTGAATQEDLQNISEAISEAGINGLHAESVFNVEQSRWQIVFTSSRDEAITVDLVDNAGNSVLQGAPVLVAAATQPAPNGGSMDFTLTGSGENGAWQASDYRDFLSDIDQAIDAMMERINTVGIAQSSLSIREETLSRAISANEAAISRIMDTDFAREQSDSVRLQILQQTATSALAQANMSPQSVLGFLG